jgi:1-deoxy-D-xylulose-5-phosphate reductoisomerase
MSHRLVTLLGATGSVGSSASDILAADPERFSVHAVVARSSGRKLAEVARRLHARLAVVADPAALDELRSGLRGSGIRATAGPEAVLEAAAAPVDITLSAIAGAAGLSATAAAIEAGNDIALANKECLICSGVPFMALAQRHGALILPVDSEHNALFQLLEGRNPDHVATYTITASGGPFRTWAAERLARATPEQALAHPTWSMGAKVTIDSATMMNKGLELIEAHHLFGIASDRMRVLVHPQSVVHGMLTFSDGSIHAELGAADMRRPIGFCLYWPDRPATAFSQMDLAAFADLSFEEPDLARFPALGLAIAALQRGAGAPTILNAADEIAVEAFLSREIAFTAISEIVEYALTEADSRGLLAAPGSIEEALALDEAGRRIARAYLHSHYKAA